MLGRYQVRIQVETPAVVPQDFSCFPHFCESYNSA
jgi:hypothetical protein